MYFKVGSNVIMKLRTIGIYAIVLSTFIAFILAMTADLDRLELGALFNLILPPFVGVIAIIIHLLVFWLSKNKKVQIFTIVILCMYLLYVGLILQFKEGYLPFPF